MGVAPVNIIPAGRLSDRLDEPRKMTLADGVSGAADDGPVGMIESTVADAAMLAVHSQNRGLNLPALRGALHHGLNSGFRVTDALGRLDSRSPREGAPRIRRPPVRWWGELLTGFFRSVK